MGFPFEHGLHTTLIAMRLADRLGLSARSGPYYACLLAHVTTDAHVTPAIFGGSLVTHAHPLIYGSRREVITGLLRALPDPESAGVRRAAQVARRVPKLTREQRPHLSAACDVAAMLTVALGMPRSAAVLPGYMFERWDGQGPLGRARGEEIAAWSTNPGWGGRLGCISFPESFVPRLVER